MLEIFISTSSSRVLLQKECQRDGTCVYFSTFHVSMASVGAGIRAVLSLSIK